ncbi:hypothetical protein Ait01nite_097610 [Actinoplanes italicus]|uniref:Uncharacterized protein n=1 Tax=Actinoplanes italicus TaxID=113567 RepID=A0A2T0JLD1_9ACTN|nr:hypothetical protein [Actinoplanes italicus]PRX08403.1 hypothetical protein CLV67_1402 [Actinoplanes italicus]GIE36716.1 hypothetical protein Ait01nite_097610 [Actinoplanes italicus]
MALLQPLSGVVFGLVGVLIVAGYGFYLAVAGLVATALFVVAARLVAALGGSVTVLWCAVASSW